MKGGKMHPIKHFENIIRRYKIKRAKTLRQRERDRKHLEQEDKKHLAEMEMAKRLVRSKSFANGLFGDHKSPHTK